MSPWNKLSKTERKHVKEYFDKIPCQGSSELTQVMLTRDEATIYMPYNELVRHTWKLIGKLKK